jgi:hypothetical protein
VPVTCLAPRWSRLHRVPGRRRQQCHPVRHTPHGAPLMLQHSVLRLGLEAARFDRGVPRLCRYRHDPPLWRTGWRGERHRPGGRIRGQQEAEGDEVVHETRWRTGDERWNVGQVVRQLFIIETGRGDEHRTLGGAWGEWCWGADGQFAAITNSERVHRGDDIRGSR